MGHREVKRVPLDFNWPLKETWHGYLLRESLREAPCPDCEHGYSPRGEYLQKMWYGYVPFDPAETGSQPLTPETPVVRAFAERNVAHAPEYYGTGEFAITREARRLIGHWNAQWCHHLAQEDVDALIAAGRLMDFTHTCGQGEGWRPKDPPPVVTAAQVNEWSVSGFGHDSINAMVVIDARCQREGVPNRCATCNGYATLEAYPGQREDIEAWQPTEPPEGEGWQLWETTTEGSPCSPVFATAEELAAWCEDGATPFARIRWTREQWLASFRQGTTGNDSLFMSGPDGLGTLGPDMNGDADAEDSEED